MRKIFNSKAWLLLEPIILLVIASLAAKPLLAAFGADGLNADAALLADPPDWTTAKTATLYAHAAKWGPLLLVAIIIAAMRGYSPFRPARDRVGGLSLLQQVGLGISIGIPLQIAASLPRWYHYNVAPLGKTLPGWDIFYAAQWTPAFWVYMLVSSIVVVSIVEEIFFRGYVLGGLLKSFSPKWAIILSGFIFAIVHLQYLQADAFLLYNSFLVFLGGALMALIVFKTNSLLPAIMMHAYGNTPQPLEWAPYTAPLAVPALIVFFLFMRRTR